MLTMHAGRGTSRCAVNVCCLILGMFFVRTFAFFGSDGVVVLSSVLTLTPSYSTFLAALSTNSRSF